MLPQGIFSVAVATVLFPTLSRLAARREVGGIRRAVGNGTRQINLLLLARIFGWSRQLHFRRLGSAETP